MIGMSPKEAFKLKEVPLAERYLLEDKLPEDGLYHYLLQLREEHDDPRTRATDRIWPLPAYKFGKIMEDPGNRVMYYLSELPPDYIQKW